MKYRLCFVSNSSSSSFVLRKSVFNKKQLNKLDKFFKIYNRQFETFIESNDDFYQGHIECHNVVFDEDYDTKNREDLCTPFSKLVDLIDSFKLTKDKKFYFKFDYSQKLPTLEEEV